MSSNPLQGPNVLDAFFPSPSPRPLRAQNDKTPEYNRLETYIVKMLVNGNIEDEIDSSRVMGKSTRFDRTGG